MSNQNANKTIFITPDLAGQRIDKLLQLHIGLADLKLTRSQIQNLIEKACVTVNDQPVKSSYLVKFNDHIFIQIPQTKTTELVPFDYKLDIIYEDQDIIVVNKAAGLVVHPAAGHEQDTLVNALLNHTKELSMKNELRPGIVHRIDKETSGLLVVAKNDQAHEGLALQFKEKQTHRIYHAIVEGTLKIAHGTLSSYLARHPQDRKRYSSVKENGKNKNKFEPGFDVGKWAITHFKKIEFSQNKTLVELKLETGRTHQIRVHMSEMGHVLTGDLTYGFSQKKMNELHLNRFYLHACELGFTHPKSKKELSFKTNWPVDDLIKIRQWGFKYYDQLD